MVCKGVCNGHKVTGVVSNNPRYIVGQKYCSVCVIFVIWEGIRCPCCSFKLRTKPKSKKYKEKLKKTISLEVLKID